jgi:hypothetical protein
MKWPKQEKGQKYVFNKKCKHSLKAQNTLKDLTHCGPVTQICVICVFALQL